MVVFGAVPTGRLATADRDKHHEAGPLHAIVVARLAPATVLASPPNPTHTPPPAGTWTCVPRQQTTSIRITSIIAP